MSLGAGGGRRTASLGTGTSRSRSVVRGVSGRTTTIPAPIQEAIGRIEGYALANAIGEVLLSPGNRLLQEISDAILLETGEYLLLEDGSSGGKADGLANVVGVGASFVDGLGRISADATVTGVMEVASAVDNLLKEDGDDILQEDGTSFLLLEVGSVAPGGALLDANNDFILDANGDYMEAV